MPFCEHFFIEKYCLYRVKITPENIRLDWMLSGVNEPIFGVHRVMAKKKAKKKTVKKAAPEGRIGRCQQSEGVCQEQRV